MKRVLVIDDSQTVRAMVRAALEPAGYEVHQAANGRAGLDVQHAVECDVVITDLIMPEKEGLETIRDLHRTWPDLPIIAISGGTAVLDKGDLLHAAEIFGATGTLAKPFTARELLDLVSRAISRAA